MPNSFYTLLIIPKEKKSVKKIGISDSFIKGLILFLTIFVPSLLFFAYDYIVLKNNEAELVFLRKEMLEQQNQIENIALQVNTFSQRMEYLNKFEQKIRLMARIDDNRLKEKQPGVGGPVVDKDRIKSVIERNKEGIIAGIHDEMDNLLASAVRQERNFTELFNFFQLQKMIKSARPSLWPVQGGIASGFGYRISPFNNEREFHNGIDISAIYGTKIVAPSDGIVTDVSYNNGLGNTVSINHGYGIVTSMGHLSRLAVNFGSRVKQGDIIGYVGSTGRSTGPHLHYSVSLNGVFVNPMKYLH